MASQRSYEHTRLPPASIRTSFFPSREGSPAPSPASRTRSSMPPRPSRFGSPNLPGSSMSTPTAAKSYPTAAPNRELRFMYASGHNGLERDNTAMFKAMRKVNSDKQFLEIARLEKRLSRLTQLLARLPADKVQSGTSKSWSPWRNDERKAIEKSVVSWQDDSSVSRCPFCMREFTTYTFRRHHCRTCGKIACADPATGCTLEVGLDVADPLERFNGFRKTLIIDVRLCKECNSTLFNKRDFEADLQNEPPDSHAYRNHIEFENGIVQLLPRFHALLDSLQNPYYPPTPSQLAETSKVRKRLLDSFARYDLAARRIRDLPKAATPPNVRKTVHQRATIFLHSHMLPLRALPKTLKHATPHGASDSGASTPFRPGIRYGNHDGRPSTTASSETGASRLSAMEAEESTLREKRAVLEEQRMFVSDMISDANRQKQFDEAESLMGNAEELAKEIARVDESINSLDFESLYLDSPQR